MKILRTYFTVLLTSMLLLSSAQPRGFFQDAFSSIYKEVKKVVDEAARNAEQERKVNMALLKRLRDAYQIGSVRLKSLQNLTDRANDANMKIQELQ